MDAADNDQGQAAFGHITPRKRQLSQRLPRPVEWRRFWRLRIMAQQRYEVIALAAFSKALLERAGMRADIATDVADILVAGDLLGHTTHGLALLAPYLAEIEKGSMAKDGAPAIVNSRPAVET